MIIYFFPASFCVIDVIVTLFYC